LTAPTAQFVGDALSELEKAPLALETDMSRPICHFEIIGRDPARLRAFYGELFGWEYEVGDPATTTVADAGNYGFLADAANDVHGGVAGGDGFEPRVVVYMSVEDVESALVAVERLGGTRVMGPEGTPGTIVVGRFTDPEGNLVGLAGPT